MNKWTVAHQTSGSKARKCGWRESCRSRCICCSNTALSKQHFYYNKKSGGWQVQAWCSILTALSRHQISVPVMSCGSQDATDPHITSSHDGTQKPEGKSHDLLLFFLLLLEKKGRSFLEAPASSRHPLISHWPEWGHMTTTSCRGCWEVRYFSGQQAKKTGWSGLATGQAVPSVCQCFDFKELQLSNPK